MAYRCCRRYPAGIVQSRFVRASPPRCLEIVHRVVPELYKANHEVLLNELSKALDAMSKKSRCVDDFAYLTLQYR